MERLLECGICFSTAGTPKLFARCHHWFCESCIDGLIRHDGNKVECPACKKEIKLPEGGAKNMTTYYYIQNIREHMQDTEKHVALMCAKGHGESATQRCQKCNIVLCHDCSLTHTRLKASQNHVLQELNKATCPKHHLDYELICDRCPRLLCTVCHLDTCTDHDQCVFDIETVKQERKDELTTLRHLVTTRFKKQEEILRPLLNDVSQLKRDAETDEKKVIQQKHVLMKEVEKQCERTLKIIKDRKDKIAALEIQLKENDQRKYLDTITIASAAALTAPTTDMLMTRKFIKQSIPVEKNVENLQLPERLRFKPLHTPISMGAFKYNPSSDVFIEVSIDGVPQGRVVIRLDTDRSPWAAALFRDMCIGVTKDLETKIIDKNTKGTSVQLTGTELWSVVKSERGNRRIELCSLSDKCPDVKRSTELNMNPGTIQMVELNNKTSIRFVIDKFYYKERVQYVDFGKVIGDGVDILTKIGNYGTPTGSVTQKIVITDSGEIL